MAKSTKEIPLSPRFTGKKRRSSQALSPAAAEDFFKFTPRDCVISDHQGNVFFKQANVKAPLGWSQLAVDIAASKYFRYKVPSQEKSREKSMTELFQRVVQAIADSGVQQGHFKSKQKKIFTEELKYILYSQKAAFNSPVWFNVGLFESYGLNSPSEVWAWDKKNQQIKSYKNALQRPQGSACFIQSVGDSIEDIFELAKNEAKLFKYGSGSGSNFSNIRSRYELLSHGGKPSGLISFLEVLDKGAGAIKSGGTNRRAAKMVVVNDDHPEILDFVKWKSREELKAKALMQAGFAPGFEGESYKTISGQNANNSVRVSDEFMQAVLSKSEHKLRSTQSKKVLNKIPAQVVWESIVQANWECADPGLQFNQAIQKWHTCPKDGAIHASNPCSEFMFLDDSACNLASINLVQFLDEQGRFQWEDFIHTVKIIFLAQEILVDHCGYPTEKIAKNSHDFRPLGIGFANLGGLLMRKGISYESQQGRHWAACIASVMTAQAYLTSIEVAEILGPFAGFKKNKKSMLKVMNQHYQSARELNEMAEDPELIPWTQLSQELWRSVKFNGARIGFRNAQASVIAPTGTIGIMMDCDTTGIEPDFSLMKSKKLAGGGEVRIVNQSLALGLGAQAYSAQEIQDIISYLEKTGTLLGSPHLQKQHLSLFKVANGTCAEDTLGIDSHLLMMSAVQPFVSGAISKTVNLPPSASLQDVSDVYIKAWKLGLKAVALYRDGSKGTQPLHRLEKMICPDCKCETELVAGCYRCPNCGSTVGCA